MQAMTLKETKRDVIADAWVDARRFLSRFAVRSREDIRPEAWADSYGIKIIEADLDGAAAQLIRIGDVVQIVLPTRIQDYCARRFAIMHELYHFLKRHPSPSPTMMCKPKWMRRGEYRTQHVFEIGLMGQRLPLVLQIIIHTAWSHGIGWGVEHWLLPNGESGLTEQELWESEPDQLPYSAR